mmetsp:Transcript_103307/g.205332  ORF Transcript_103307/g.205332 Transcript_103307/m.205332 type:complete len:118 (+) Transcript_103307:103-456(+)
MLHGSSPHLFLFSLALLVVAEGVRDAKHANELDWGGKKETCTCACTAHVIENKWSSSSAPAKQFHKEYTSTYQCAASKQEDCTTTKCQGQGPQVKDNWPTREVGFISLVEQKGCACR